MRAGWLAGWLEQQLVAIQGALAVCICLFVHGVAVCRCGVNRRRRKTRRRGCERKNSCKILYQRWRRQWWRRPEVETGERIERLSLKRCVTCRTNMRAPFVYDILLSNRMGFIRKRGRWRAEGARKRERYMKNEPVLGDVCRRYIGLPCKALLRSLYLYPVW